MIDSHPGIRKAITLWWIPFLTGVALISMGLWTFVSPENPTVPLSVLFGICITLVGVFELLFAFSGRRPLHTWAWTIASGIFDLAVGGYILAYPGMTLEILPFVLGFWLLFRGFTGIGFSLDMRRWGGDWKWFLVIAIIIILLGILVLAVPAFGLLHLVIWTACSFIFIGVFRILLAMYLRRMKDELE
jgi:uncharacterized membrane protein HdeD (DUF308 family)